MLLLALELSHAGNSFNLHLLGGGFLLARVLHAAGLYGRFKFTVAGAALNYLVLTVMGVWAIAARLGS